MAISSPLTPKTSEKTIKNLQGIILNKTKVSRETFRTKTILQDRRIENDRRALQEDALEAPDIVRKPGGAAQLIAGSAKGFFERLMGFLGYLTAGWLLSNLPTWIGMGKEFIARTVKMGNLIGGFLFNTTTIFNNLTSLLGATLTNIIAFDFFDTSGRVGTAFEELQLSVDNWGTGFEDALNLITSPLTEGVASGEDTPPPGTQYTDEGAYETPPSSGGTPAPQVNKNLKFTEGQNIKGQIGQSNIDYVQVTSLRGNREGGYHGGMDIAAPTGTYIALRVDCEVVATKNQPGGYGRVIDVWISQYGVQLRFAHNSSIIITSGKIPSGTSFARVGSTGRSTGPHIHLEADTTKGRSDYSGSMDPSRFVPLISLTKSPSKPTPAPASVASSSTSQPQQNLMGTPSSGGISGRGVDKGVSVAKKLIADLGITPAQAAGIVGNFLYESAGMNPGEREGAPFGTPEKPPAMGTLYQGYGWAQWTNSAPGDRLDKFLKSYGGDKGKIATDDDNYRYLMKELRGGEPLKGMPKDDPQAASDWFRKNWERAGIPADEKRRKETLAVFNKIKGLSRDQAEIDVAAAPAQTSSPAPAQITSQSQSQSQISQSSQALTPERTGPTVIVTQNPSSPARQMMYSGGGGSSGGGSPQMSDFALLNNFIKNKLLLDLAYL
jgi:murein DD-endopeptidase MepM/ murein hydrolase activator NlpD